LWQDNEFEDKRKLRYYKEVINPNLEDENYLFVITNIKKKIRIAKIRTNSYEQNNETKP
jgi:predicted glutamine amidotransferase